MSVTRVSASAARERLSDLLNEVSVRGDRIVLERHGKRVAAMISASDLDLLQALEDRYDLEEMRRVLAKSDKRVPWEKIKKRLDL